IRQIGKDSLVKYIVRRTAQPHTAVYNHTVRSPIKSEWKLFVLLALLLLLRLVSLGTLALSDPTESRYADIALDMSRSGNWIMPQILIHGSLEPYWGKPPLHFWLTSFTFRLFGTSEVTARFPSFVAGLLMLLLTFLYTKQFRNARTAFLASIMLASS